MPNQTSIDERALEEWKQLQAIIGRLETLEFQVRSWLLVLLGALVAGTISNSSTFTRSAFLTAAACVIFAFSIMELLYRNSKRAAIDRVARVESSLRNSKANPYDGPQICEALSRRTSFLTAVRRLPREFMVTQVWSFYILMLITVVAIFFKLHK